MVQHQTFNSIGTHIYNGVVYDNQFCDLHFHNSFEFIYVIDGTIIPTVNSTEMLLNNGDCLLIAPNMVHDLSENGNVRFFIGVFSADFVHSFFKKDNSVPFYKFVPEKEVMDYLLKYMIYTGTPDLYMLKSCLYAICDQAIKLSDVHTDNNINPNFVMSVNEYISKHLAEPFSRKDIASVLNYEEHYFSTLFNNNFHIGLNKYVALFRFKHACDLLLRTKKSIAEIAFESGFSTLRSFNRTFKELSGRTPNEYRNMTTLITEPDLKNQQIVMPRI